MPSRKNNPIRLRAFAKINLSLKVTGKLPEGYHAIDSVMQSISLHDEIDIKAVESGIRVHCSVAGIEDNTAFKAAELILREVRYSGGVEIHVKKNIPLSSGLGGGSADAAATLIGIDKLLGMNLHKEKMMEIGLKIGSDVPFCLVGGTARCTGRGEQVLKANPQTGSAFLLVIPRITVSTRSVYDRFDKVGSGNSDNDLEEAAVSLFPEIAKTKDVLNRVTGRDWKMSGSGPSLFLELGDVSDADRYMSEIEKLDAEHHLVKRTTSGVEEI